LGGSRRLGGLLPGELPSAFKLQQNEKAVAVPLDHSSAESARSAATAFQAFAFEDPVGAIRRIRI
jgi:hypothetical protein